MHPIIITPLWSISAYMKLLNSNLVTEFWLEKMVDANGNVGGWRRNFGMGIGAGGLGGRVVTPFQISKPSILTFYLFDRRSRFLHHRIHSCEDDEEERGKRGRNTCWVLLRVGRTRAWRLPLLTLCSGFNFFVLQLESRVMFCANWDIKWRKRCSAVCTSCFNSFDLCILCFEPEELIQ